jgi:molybdopterin molybdotransferase
MCIVTSLPGIQEALALVLARVQPLDSELVPVALAAGRVLTADAHAPVDLPLFDSSAMDGFAVRAVDAPGRLRVAGQSQAGSPFEGTVGRGEAVAISTGAVVPDGSDAVVPVERVRRDGDHVEVQAVAPGTHVRGRGGDVAAGDIVATAGTRLAPRHLGAVAAAGLAEISCARRPRVVVLATGSELRTPGTTLGPGEIYESNTTLLAAQAASAGAVVDVLPAVTDDPAATRVALERGLDADVLITSGGVSVGPHDLVRGALAELGAEEVFWRVAVKPGKPVAFAVSGATLVFGLPGNPVSSLVSFELFVRPALLALQQARDPGPSYAPGRLGAPVRRAAERDELLRARSHVQDGVVVLDPLEGQDSHMIVRSSAADSLVLIERGEGELPAGSPVGYLPI